MCIYYLMLNMQEYIAISLMLINRVNSGALRLGIILAFNRGSDMLTIYSTICLVMHLFRCNVHSTWVPGGKINHVSYSDGYIKSLDSYLNTVYGVLPCVVYRHLLNSLIIICNLMY